MTPQDYAELLSLGLTIPTVVMSVWVVLMFVNKALEGLRIPNRTAVQWFAMGVAIGFFGSSIDNIYWAIPWTASFLGLSAAEDLIQFGVYPNVIFRQLCGIAAAYCHIRCGIHYIDGVPERDELSKLNLAVNLSLATGLLFVLALTTARMCWGY